ncbi:MAG: hypothetical protein M1548_06055 [Actinobacteria bacterium]|nr:hypothetical protein [Actinomycetota bacterium]
MPELPDVEIARRTLIKSVVGKEILSVEAIRTPGKLIRTLQDISEEEFRSAITGTAFKDFIRKGKFLIAPLTSGKSVVFHFMLSGWLDYFRSEDEVPDKASKDAKLRFTFSDGSFLLFTDPRNLGRVFLVAEGEFERLGVLARMGVEPLGPDFTLDRFKEIVSASAKSVKDLLTDQEKIAGIGNIYSDEVMRRAGIRPDRSAGSLSQKEIEKLYRTIPEVLEEGIAEMEAGRPRHMLEWRRKGALCPDCGGEVVAVKRGATHYYWCPKCQE